MKKQKIKEKILKKIFLAGFFVLIIFLIFLFKSFNKDNSSFLRYKIEGKNYNLLISRTPQEWEKGLMFYKNKKELKGADGMIFIFPDKDFRSFWNKNTYLNLDIYWLDNDKIVGKDFLPSILKTKNIYTISSPVKINKVIEIIKE